MTNERLASDLEDIGWLKNRVALVTGGGGGIGSALARRLAAEGVRVVIVERAGVDTSGVMKACEEAGAAARTVHADLLDLENIEHVVEECTRQFGRLDFVINAAGLYLGGPLEDTKIAAVRRMMDLNVNALIGVCQAAVKHLERSDRRIIINIGSYAADIPIGGEPVYCASKAAVLAFSRSLWLQLRERGVLVSSLNPAATLTSMTGGRGFDDSKLVGTDDLAAAVMFLLRDLSPRAWVEQLTVRCARNPGDPVN